MLRAGREGGVGLVIVFAAVVGAWYEEDQGEFEDGDEEAGEECEDEDCEEKERCWGC